MSFDKSHDAALHDQFQRAAQACSVHKCCDILHEIMACCCDTIHNDGDNAPTPEQIAIINIATANYLYLAALRCGESSSTSSVDSGSSNSSASSHRLSLEIAHQKLSEMRELASVKVVAPRFEAHPGNIVLALGGSCKDDEVDMDTSELAILDARQASCLFTVTLPEIAAFLDANRRQASTFNAQLFVDAFTYKQSEGEFCDPIARCIWTALHTSMSAVLADPSYLIPTLRGNHGAIFECRAKLLLFPSTVAAIVSQVSTMQASIEIAAGAQHMRGLRELVTEFKSSLSRDVEVFFGSRSAKSIVSSSRKANSTGSVSVTLSRHGREPYAESIDLIYNLDIAVMRSGIVQASEPGKYQKAEEIDAYFLHLRKFAFPTTIANIVCILSLEVTKYIVDPKYSIAKLILNCKQVDLFNAPVLLAPVNLRGHFGVFAIDTNANGSLGQPKKLRVWYLDSLQGYFTSVKVLDSLFQNVVRFLKWWWPDAAITAADIKCVRVPQQPLESNACGLYAAFFVHSLLTILHKKDVDTLFQKLDQWSCFENDHELPCSIDIGTAFRGKFCKVLRDMMLEHCCKKVGVSRECTDEQLAGRKIELQSHLEMSKDLHLAFDIIEAQRMSSSSATAAAAVAPSR